jgi:hypothetical protein
LLHLLAAGFGTTRSCHRLGIRSAHGGEAGSAEISPLMHKYWQRRRKADWWHRAARRGVLPDGSFMAITKEPGPIYQLFIGNWPFCKSSADLQREQNALVTAFLFQHAVQGWFLAIARRARSMTSGRRLKHCAATSARLGLAPVIATPVQAMHCKRLACKSGPPHAILRRLPNSRKVASLEKPRSRKAS